MADKSDNSRREIEKGRREIADTRSAIAEKVAILEDRVEKTVDAVKHGVDLQYQVKQRPWLMIGGSLLVGYTLGRRGGAPSTTAETSREAPARPEPPIGIASGLTHQVKHDLAALKGAALGAAMSTLWAMAKQVLLPAARQQQNTNRVQRPTAAKSPSSDTPINGTALMTPRGPN
jgi:hypothetical protein